MNKRVAVMLADGFEPVEGIAPVDILRRGGVEVVTVSIMGARTVVAAHGVPVVADVLLNDVSLGDFDMIVVPGGSVGVQNLSACEPLLEALKTFDAKGRYIGAICAGPMILADLHLLEGRKATCYPGCQEGFPEGAFQGVRGVQRDGNLITASGPGQAVEFGFELLRVFEGDAVADEVARGMLCKE